MAKRRKPATPSPVVEPTPTPADDVVVQTPVEIELTWRGVTIYLNSKAQGLGFGFSHRELHVAAPKGAPIPVTEAGHSSHFTRDGTVEDAGGPLAYVEAWLNDAVHAPTWRRREAGWRQLGLFS